MGKEIRGNVIYKMFTGSIEFLLLQNVLGDITGIVFLILEMELCTLQYRFKKINTKLN